MMVFETLVPIASRPRRAIFMVEKSIVKDGRRLKVVKTCFAVLM